MTGDKPAAVEMFVRGLDDPDKALVACHALKWLGHQLARPAFPALVRAVVLDSCPCVRETAAEVVGWG